MIAIQATAIHGGDAPTGDLSCPRCGYALRGRIVPATECGTASEDGTCSECGIEFQWAELVCGTVDLPRLLFEHARGVPRACLALPITLLATLAPWWLWRRLRLEHAIRPARCVGLALVGVGLIPIVIAVAAGVSRAWQLAPLNGSLVTSNASTNRNASITFRIAIAPADAADSILAATVDPTSRLRAGGVVALYTPTAMTDLRTQRGLALPPPWTAVHPLPSALRWVGPFAYEHLVAFPLFFVLGAALSGATFALFPFARRRAKVHWRHIGRCVAYLCAGSFLVFGLYLASAGMHHERLGFALIPMALAVFWYAAAKHYLRMEKSAVVAAAVTTVTTLIVVALGALLDAMSLTRV